MNALIQAASTWASPPESAPTLTPEERTAITSALAGDDAAFEELIRLFSRKMFAIAFGILDHGAETEDVVQEVFCKVHRQRKGLRDPEKFPAWLGTITRNAARDKLHSRFPRAEVGDDNGVSETLLDEKTSSPDTALDRGERDRQLHSALAKLPESHRIALTLRYLEGLDHRQIETTMGVSNGALRGILARALASLRRELPAPFFAQEKTI